MKLKNPLKGKKIFGIPAMLVLLALIVVGWLWWKRRQDAAAADETGGCPDGYYDDGAGGCIAYDSSSAAQDFPGVGAPVGSAIYGNGSGPPPDAATDGTGDTGAGGGGGGGDSSGGDAGGPAPGKQKMIFRCQSGKGCHWVAAQKVGGKWQPKPGNKFGFTSKAHPKAKTGGAKAGPRSGSGVHPPAKNKSKAPKSGAPGSGAAKAGGARAKAPGARKSPARAGRAPGHH